MSKKSEKNNEMSQNVAQYKVITSKDNIRLRPKGIPYAKIASLLLDGHEIFIPCERKKASYIRRKLEKLVCELIEAYPCIYGENTEGYSFRISVIQGILKQVKIQQIIQNQKKKKLPEKLL